LFGYSVDPFRKPINEIRRAHQITAAFTASTPAHAQPAAVSLVSRQLTEHVIRGYNAGVL